MPERQIGPGKEPVTVLAGPYGHPFHPILVTVPIGAWVASFVFDLLSRWTADSAAFALGARWLVAIGVVGALAAAAVGVLDFFAIPPGTPAKRTALTHMVLNLAVTAGFVASFLVRDGEGPVGWGVIALSAVALGALGISGWLGGKLTYRFGVRVVDEQTQADGYQRR